MDCFLILLTLAQIPALPLQRLHLLGHLRRDAGSLATVDLGLLHPLVQGPGRATDICGNRHDRLPARSMLTFVVEDQPHRAATHFRGNLFGVLLMMLHPTQELEPPANPVRFMVTRCQSLSLPNMISLRFRLSKRR